MSKSKKYLLIKQLLTSIILALIGCTSVVFTVLYLNTFESGFCYLYSTVITAISVSIISILTVLSITFLRYKKEIVYKILSLFVVLIFLFIISLYLLKSTGLLDKFDSVEKFRLYIHSFGNGAVFLFILIQFLQVVVLPIPAFITVGAGVLLFGPFWGALYSSIGIITGSLVAFFIGRIFGFKVAKWLVGEDNLKKGLETIKGKDKLILTFMFLFPFFPDDILCFVAGITTMSKSFFLLMIVVTRIISIFASSYSMNNSIIPYNTWWGILIWILFFTFAFITMLILYKKGDAIENAIFRKKKKDRK
jgi:uncharacterized membrane protein YdjX (TVP38/TMEM64 family)